MPKQSPVMLAKLTIWRLLTTSWHTSSHRTLLATTFPDFVKAAVGDTVFKKLNSDTLKSVLAGADFLFLKPVLKLGKAYPYNKKLSHPLIGGAPPSPTDGYGLGGFVIKLQC